MLLSYFVSEGGGVGTRLLYIPLRIRILNTLHAWCTLVDCHEHQDTSGNGKITTHAGAEADLQRKKQARGQ